MSKTGIPILPEQLPICPVCEDSPQQLHEIDNNLFGCDKCKNVFHVHNGDVEYEEVKKPNTDEFGNPLFPEEVL